MASLAHLRNPLCTFSANVQLDTSGFKIFLYHDCSVCHRQDMRKARWLFALRIQFLSHGFHVHIKTGTLPLASSPFLPCLVSLSALPLLNSQAQGAAQSGEVSCLQKPVDLATFPRETRNSNPDQELLAWPISLSRTSFNAWKSLSCLRGVCSEKSLACCTDHD